MRVRNKGTEKEHEITRNDWDRLGELGMQSGYKVISNDEITAPDTQKVRSSIIRIDLGLSSAKFDENFDSSKYSVEDINKFLKDNPDKKKYFVNDTRKTIKR